jgi:membrane protease YdiL (CAAX protease family)
VSEPPLPLPRWLAAVQAVAVCGIPTQALIAVALLFTTNLRIFEPDGSFSLEFFAVTALLDTAVIALLIRLFLELSGETSRSVFVGPVPVAREILRGLALVPVAIIGAGSIVWLLRRFAPWLHTVPANPLESFMNTPLDASIFVLVVMLAGGVREELMRAFIMHRFEQRLGGMRVGLILYAVLFALLHAYQSLDAAIAIGALGLFWGWLYMKRRSAIMAIANHAGFDVAQVVLGVYARSLGG